MSITTIVAGEPNPRRRSVDKSTKKVVEKRMKLGIILSNDAYKRIGVASIMIGKPQGEIIEHLIQTHLKDIVFYQKGMPSAQDNVSTTQPAHSTNSPDGI